MSKKHIIITGGAGFIGSHICREFISRDYDVYVIDNFTTGDINNLTNIDVKAILKGNSAFVNIPSEWHKDLAAIVHLGIPSSSPLYRKNPFNISTAVRSYVNMLELAKEARVPLLYASSSSLYNGIEDQEESAIPLVKDYYTEARFFLERLAALYKELHGVRSVGFRFFSVYGPNEKYKKTFANIITQFLEIMGNRKPPTIYGDGMQTRDFIYVTDLVKIIADSLERIDEVPSVMNIGTGVETSFNDVVKIINNELKTNIAPRYIRNPIQNYVQKTQMSPLSQFHHVFPGFEFVSVETGIRLLLVRRQQDL